MASPTFPGNADAENKTSPLLLQPTNTNTPADPGPRPWMTLYEKSSLAVNTLGFLLVATSLLATREQVMQANDQFRNGLQQRGLEQVLATDRIFIEYPEIRDYFYKGKDIDEKDPHRRRVEAVAELHLDVFSYSLKSRKSFPDHYPFPESTETWMREMLRTSPVMRNYLEKHKDWYPELIYLSK